MRLPKNRFLQTKAYLDRAYFPGPAAPSGRRGSAVIIFNQVRRRATVNLLGGKGRCSRALFFKAPLNFAPHVNLAAAGRVARAQRWCLRQIWFDEPGLITEGPGGSPALPAIIPATPVRPARRAIPPN